MSDSVPTTLFTASEMSDADAFAEGAKRRIGVVCDSHRSDLDKLRRLIADGGDVKTMRAAVNAYDALCAVQRELAVAMQRVDEPLSRSQEVENLIGEETNE